MYVRPYTLFSTLHPVLLFVYAMSAPVMAMLSRSPVCLLITLSCAVCVHSFYMGGRSAWDGIKVSLPFLVLISLLNMLTNPGGMTVLFRAGTRNFTLESLCYGIAGGLMLAAVFMWFRCFSAIVPNDKFLYLFGRRFQRTALLLSMILKLFPETHYKIHCIKMAEDNRGYKEKESIKTRLSRGMGQMSALLEWSMEDSIETADSMKARGYGNGVRTSYEKYSFTRYDAAATVVFILLLSVSVTGIAVQNSLFRFYPLLAYEHINIILEVSANICYIIYLLLPIWMEAAKRGGHRR